MRTRVDFLFRWLGGVGIAFVVLLAAYTATEWIAPRSVFGVVLEWPASSQDSGWRSGCFA